ncbi:hypothetical protein ACFL0Z_01620 [Patescibacteria group bacterium]
MTTKFDANGSCASEICLVVGIVVLLGIAITGLYLSAPEESPAYLTTGERDTVIEIGIGQETILSGIRDGNVRLHYCGIDAGKAHLQYHHRRKTYDLHVSKGDKIDCSATLRPVEILDVDDGKVVIKGLHIDHIYKDNKWINDPKV